MRFRKLKANEHIEGLQELYEEAFPKEEQIPYDRLIQLVGEMSLDFVVYYQDACEQSEILGFTIVFPAKNFDWFWYFAVRKDFRGKGFGQQILTQLIREYSTKSLILDMESPTQICENQEQRKRRHRFYLRNGFRDTNVYKTFDSITYTILIKGEKTFTMKDYDDVINELKCFWWRKDLENETEKVE